MRSGLLIGLILLTMLGPALAHEDTHPKSLSISFDEMVSNS